MSETTTIQRKEFQAEVQQLLHIVINSLYTDREIFLRELISNAADSLEKLRYIKVSNQEIQDDGLPLAITIATDNIAHTLTISDSGIGMTAEELVENLGTIAHSGSKAFLKQMAEGQRHDVNLIGQFGVGFYSAFMVAKKVTVYTRSYKAGTTGQVWTSEGSGSYDISQAPDLRRGTRIVLHLKDDAQEFAREETVKRIIKQYSGFVPFPIELNGQQLNTVQALWTKNKNEISSEDYNEFYKYIANAHDEPTYAFQFSADAPLAINALLFVPGDNLERFGFGRLDPGVNLYCRKVLIQEKSDAILPDWLRFIRGVVDSEELPLNISRETMQDSTLVAKLRRVITGRFLKFLNEKAKSGPEGYVEFWQKFGNFIREGAATDTGHREELVKLLRFESSKSEPGQLVSLEQYLERLQDKQEDIYFINGSDRDTIEAGPYLEIFREQDFEVLYTIEPVDDYILTQLQQFQGKKLVSVDVENLELPGEQREAGVDAMGEDELKELASWLKETLGDSVSDVRGSKRLVDSPAIVLSHKGMTNSMQRMMQLMHKELDKPGPVIMEINPDHPIIKGINNLRRYEENFARTAASQLLDNALLAAGLVFDTRGMVERMNRILERALD